MPSPELLEKVREAKPGYCLYCGCTYLEPCAVAGVGTCGWVVGTNRRLCTAHSPSEIAAAARALKDIDREAGRV